MMDNFIFRKRLRELRIEKHRDVGINVVSELCGLHPDLYRRYENGEMLPNYKNLCLIAEYYNCSIDYLVGRSNQKEINE